ncbi:MAG TPA: transglutaminase-like domain-containing protein [Anaerolineales bacterium]|nr:transglutaminase-like domain-containing protein [Anaerolineales bacterium]
MIERIFRRIVSAEVIGMALVVGALQVLTYGISGSLRNTDTTYFFWVCFLAALIAFGLSKRNANGIRAAAAIIALGALGIWILGARLPMPLLDLGNALIQVLSQAVPAIRSETPIDTTAIADAWRVVAEASIALGMRVQVWLRSIDRNVMVNDALVRNMVWMMIMWLLSAWMGWFTARRNAMAALLPSLVLLAAITSYSERRVETLWSMVFILLLLMGIWNYKNHTVQWDRKKVDYSDSIRYDVSQAVIFLSIAIGVLALITPSVSWRAIRDYLRERNQNEVADMLGVQQQQVAAQNAPVQKPSLPRDHLLTGGFANSEKVVMTIRTGELPPIVNPMLTDDAPRHYWRSTIYDTYVGAGWVTGVAFPQSVQANTPLIPGLLNGYKTLHLDVEMVEPEGKLFWSGILFSADVPFRANWRVRPQSNLFADQAALLEADMFAAVSTARAYRAQSYIPLATIEDLRAATTDYPEEIRERYLRLPSSVPDRVRDLAREITRDKSTAYDKARSIEAYLRTIPYDLEVPAPPEDEDVADYFLFELKKGYCDYYASAMVVLARASGLPARFVSGYASGSYDAANAQYIVRELHAHSWPEVYFPEIGWIEFEPTASQPEIELAETNEVVAAPRPDSAAAQLLYRFRLQTAIYWLSPVAIVLLILILYLTLIERWLYMRLAPATALEKIYRRLYRLGRPLAGERTKAETANEFMQKLVNNLDGIKQYSRFKKLFVRAEDEIELLTGMYQETLFSDNKIQKHHVRKALKTWKGLRLRLLFTRMYVAVRRALFPTKKAHVSIPKLPSEYPLS